MRTLEPGPAYSLWARSYDATPNPLLALEERCMAPVVAELAPGVAVDIGCGTGRWARHGALAGALYLGFDASPAMLREARADRGSVRLAAADAGRLPVRTAVSDLTLCSFAVAYFERLEDALSEAARVTRRGGTVLVTDLHPQSGWERTFCDGVSEYRIAHRTWSAWRIRKAATAAGLVLEWEKSYVFGEQERPIFQNAGRDDLFEAAAGVPALWAALWKRR